MTASFCITLVSITLFLYWFRYTCVLILSARPARDVATRYAAANRLAFLEVERAMGCSMERCDLESLQARLDADYRSLTATFAGSAALRNAVSGTERVMLTLDYKLLRGWFKVSQTIAPLHSCGAVREMALIVKHLATAAAQAQA